ncbi:MAG: hypothetical protein RL226_1621 [Bacteroidota bacterium]|jgi:predicted amidohydrolase
MNICIAQTKPFVGDVSANIEAHKRFIKLASTCNANAIFFPELSLTGYEPKLANELATQPTDKRLEVFQDLSDQHTMTIGLGVPTKTASGVRISMIIFQPNEPYVTYSKQLLHSDELPYFESGNSQVIVCSESSKIAPAICYESLHISHADNAVIQGATVYLASVAKAESGVAKAYVHYPMLAKKHRIPVLMSNSIGYCDNFMSAGKSAVWTKDGKLAGQLDEQNEGIIVFNTETEDVIVKTTVAWSNIETD